MSLSLATTVYDKRGEALGDTFIINVNDRKEKALKIMDDVEGNMRKLHDNNYGIVDYVLLDGYKAIYKRRYNVMEG